jgi:hypothetical protein
MGRRHLHSLASARRFGAALLLGPLAAAPTAAPAQEPPALLLITTETINPGNELQYDAVEKRLTELCARRCPNDYLALATTSAPMDVWWFVAYASQVEVERIAAEYADDAVLLRELEALSAQKRALTSAPASYMTARRPDLGDGAPWRIGAVPFTVIAERREAEPRIGSVFETADGVRFAVVGAETAVDAQAAAARLGAGARIFAVNPEWSKPAQAWLAANPDLWRR